MVRWRRGPDQARGGRGRARHRRGHGDRRARPPGRGQRRAAWEGHGRDGFFADWRVEPRWNLCNAPGGDNGGKVEAVGRFLAGDGRALVCTHATFRFAAEKFGVEAFDGRLVAVDEFHHVSVSEDNRLGEFVRQLIARDKAHVVAMTGSYFRGDAAAVLMPEDERRFETVTYTYYEQLSG